MHYGNRVRYLCFVFKTRKLGKSAKCFLANWFLLSVNFELYFKHTKVHTFWLMHTWSDVMWPALTWSKVPQWCTNTAHATLMPSNVPNAALMLLVLYEDTLAWSKMRHDAQTLSHNALTPFEAYCHCSPCAGIIVAVLFLLFLASLLIICCILILLIRKKRYRVYKV